MNDLIKRAGRFQGWEYRETMTSGTNSDSILLPPIGDGANVSVSLIITSGEGKIQFTTSGDGNLDSAVWQDWPNGACTATISDSLISPVTALRLVRISGTVGIEIVI